MFKKITADALGLSDISVVITREYYDKTDADDYCFTNRAIIHVDGKSAMSKKRLLRRYDYLMHNISNVFLETAGTIDLDVEIKFTIDNTPLSIDIHKRFIDDIKDLYKALHAISYGQKQNAYKLEVAEKSSSVASSSIGRIGNDNVPPSASFEEITCFANNWMIDHKGKYKKGDFSHIFDLYMNN
ncbi:MULTISPECIES: PH domain-containing protein [unclassified Lysinibacillus]|uniref:PH domain-containing protein n=1 Tax=unclassified Lysinibacillus TaxID=2636778 RepID=UPI00380A2171